ncbi:unnamed protein product [Ilex paraguariensis]|uniref:poly(A)-specific ribonuclease n=1 Tax=Ilex paraguariensis TaxID=185542 RepID=A0ABC8TVT6_9AQUA
MGSIEIVWSNNFEDAMTKIAVMMETFPIVAVDTEFPGFLHNTPRAASESERYDDLKYNVDRMKIIQLGITLFDRFGVIGGVWQINFCNFDPDLDDHVSSSIELLKRNGIDLVKNKRDGVDAYTFADKFCEILVRYGRDRVRWVTFHGLYDLAYMLKIVIRDELPSSIMGYVEHIGHVFGRVYDVKFMAKYCHGLLDGELGLEKLAKLLDVERFGEAHQAGSDSLLTAATFSKMKVVYGLPEMMFEGFLYGISARIKRPRPMIAVLPPPPQPILLGYIR